MMESLLSELEALRNLQLASGACLLELQLIARCTDRFSLD